MLSVKRKNPFWVPNLPKCLKGEGKTTINLIYDGPSQSTNPRCSKNKAAVLTTWFLSLFLPPNLRSRVLIAKLQVTQLVKKSPIFYETLERSCCIQMPTGPCPEPDESNHSAITCIKMKWRMILTWGSALLYTVTANTQTTVNAE